MAKFIVVGIDDPYGETPLQPDITSSSGQKLWSMTGLPMVRYCQLFERHNLFEIDEPHNIDVARLKARRILYGVDTRYVNTYIICMGRIVADAFSLYGIAPLHFRRIQRKTMAAYLPHTSGVNRWYNSPNNYAVATGFLRSVASVAVGEMDEHLINPDWDKDL